MAFIFYFIVILVSAASVMFGIDLATSPLPSTPNVPIGQAHAPLPAPVKEAHVKANRAADNRELSPVFPATPGAKKEAQSAQPATSGAAAKDASSNEWLPPAPQKRTAEVATQDAQPKQAAQPTRAATPPQEPKAAAKPPEPSQPKQAATQAEQAQSKQAEASTPPAAKPEAEPQAVKSASEKPVVDKTVNETAPPALDNKPQQAAAHSAPHCDVAACSAAYHSFRASDCSYQPYDGPRQACTKSGGTVTASAPARRWHRRYSERRTAPESATAREPDDRHELDEVTRIVRHMTRGERRDVAVQDSRGHIIVVHPGRARAYGPYGDYYEDDYDDDYADGN